MRAIGHPIPNGFRAPRVVLGALILRVSDARNIKLRHFARSNALAVLSPSVEGSRESRPQLAIVPNLSGVVLVNDYDAVKVKGGVAMKPIPGFDRPSLFRWDQ